jgi:hypothetical protein
MEFLLIEWLKLVGAARRVRPVDLQAGHHVSLKRGSSFIHAAVGAHWELPGAMARKDQSRIFGLFLDETV